jgi:hypothetical protein
MDDRYTRIYFLQGCVGEKSVHRPYLSGGYEVTSTQKVLVVERLRCESSGEHIVGYELNHDPDFAYPSGLFVQVVRTPPNSPDTDRDSKLPKRKPRR